MGFTLASLERMRRGHEFVLAETNRAVQETLEYGGRFALQHVQQYPGFTPRTGKLQRSTKYRVVRTSGGKLLKLTNATPYADPIESGADPHEIVGRTGMLRFMGRDGKLVFRKRVNHPGNKPYKFLYRATSAAYRVLGRSLEQRLSAIGKRF